MRFKKLSLKNFLSFGKEEVLCLENRGLVGVFGVNKESEAFGSNGAGKSTILEAIIWCLWGETLRGLKTDEIINNKIKKNCAVSLWIEDDKITYRVERTRKLSKTKKPNALRIWANDEEVTKGTNSNTQSLITSLIGMDLNTFKQSVLLTDKTKSFCLLTDDEKKRVLEDVLQLDVFRRSKALVSYQLKEEEKALAVVTQSLEQYKKQLEQNLSSLNNFRRKFDEYEDQRRQRRVSLENEISQLDSKLENVSKTEENLQKVDEEYQKINAELDSIDQELSDIKIKQSTFDKQAIEDSHEIEMLMAKVGQTKVHLNETFVRLNSLADAQCPTCLQRVDTVVVEDKFVELEEQLREESEKENTLNGLMDGLNTLRHQKTEEFNTLLNTINKKQRELNDLRSSFITKYRKLEADLLEKPYIERRQDELRGILDTIDAEENPHTDLVENSKNDVRNQIKILRTATAKHKALEINVKNLRFWNHGFGNKGVKSFMMDTAIPFLNDRAQKYANILSGNTLSIKISTTSRLKKGNETDKISINVINEHGADIYKGNSSGESRRSDVAIGWALADLAATRANKPKRFRGLDEPFENIDPPGVSSVMNLLNSVVEDYETIFCISHNPELADYFQNKISIVKENGFSKIEDFQ